jgi:spermidine synthase
VRTFFSFVAISILSQGLMADERWYEETLYPKWHQRIKMDRVWEVDQADLQEITIFENEHFGRVLALDGVIQVAEADEFIYHEMMVHVPLLAHGNVEEVLIVGGGDGGIMRELVRHRNIKRIVLVEIDGSVIEFSKKYLPDISRGAFEDPRLEVVIADGSKYVKTTNDRFDVIICDSTDPIGPGQVLFTQEFYGDCKGILKEKGIFVNQNGAPFVQGSEITDTYLRRKPYFADTTFYLAPIPTYVGGFMAFGWATDEKSYRTIDRDELNRRLQRIDGEMKYYNPEIHQASFALPNFVKMLFEE